MVLECRCATVISKQRHVFQLAVIKNYENRLSNFKNKFIVSPLIVFGDNSGALFKCVKILTHHLNGLQSHNERSKHFKTICPA